MDPIQFEKETEGAKYFHLDKDDANLNDIFLSMFYPVLKDMLNLLMDIVHLVTLPITVQFNMITFSFMIQMLMILTGWSNRCIQS